MEQDKKTVCQICYKDCCLAEGQTGECGVRRNVEGRLMSVGYGKVSHLALRHTDDITARFCQDSQILSIGLAESERADFRLMRPIDVLHEIKALRPHGCVGAAYMYYEPLYHWEFVKDTAMLVHNEGLKNILMTNGLCSRKILGKFKKDLDAVVIEWRLWDIDEDHDRRRLEFIRQAISQYHVEVTCLIEAVPDENKAADANEANDANEDRTETENRIAVNDVTEINNLSKVEKRTEERLNAVTRQIAAIRRGIPFSLSFDKAGSSGRRFAAEASQLSEIASRELSAVTVRPL